MRQDADTSKLKELFEVEHQHSRKYKTPDTQCLCCDFVGVKGQDLYYHIKSLHPDSQSYACWDCDKNFNTDHDHLNHMNSMHRSKAFRCKHCSYCAATESQMLGHARTHTLDKFKCTSCEVKLATKDALWKHTLLYITKEEWDCDKCHKKYISHLALKIHQCGHHGPGYQCPKCEKVFDVPIKKARQLQRCNQASKPSGSPKGTASMQASSETD